MLSVYQKKKKEEQKKKTKVSGYYGGLYEYPTLAQRRKRSSYLGKRRQERAVAPDVNFPGRVSAILVLTFKCQVENYSDSL